jgi:protein TonB
MKAVISKDGSISALEIMSATNPVFNKAAIDAVRQWKYRPYTLNGEPTEVMTTITVNFAVNPPPSPPNGSMIQPDEHIPSLPH